MALRTALVGASLSVAFALVAPSARACGGCLHPAPPPVDAGPRSAAPFIVTDHRMVLAVGPDATVLWDQVRYAGRPEDFAWILPVRGDVTVTLGSGAFLDEIDALTAPSVASPNYVCNPTTGSVTVTPAPPSPRTAPLSDELRAGGVDVVREAVVGPYEVTTVRGTDPLAIHAWLGAHGYRIGDDAAPALAWYTDLRMDFVVARLRPDEGVQAIQPLRVRFPAGTATLPLRMIQAGAADRTGLALFVVASSRVEATNFSAATVPSDDVTWDFGNATSDYNAAFTRALQRAGGRAWVTELAGPYPPANPFTDAAGDDWSVASAGLAQPWITRLRTSLSRADLDADLALGASDGAPVSNVLPAGRWSGQPSTLCAPTRPDGGRSSPSFVRNDGGCGCRAAPASARPSVWLLALAALGLRRRRAVRPA